MANQLLSPALLFLLATSSILFAEGFYLSPTASCGFRLHETHCPTSLRPTLLGVSGGSKWSKSFELSMASGDESGDSSSSSSNSGVVELAEDEDESPNNDKQEQSGAAPFLSQGEISEEALNPDLSDPKQTRVILYIIISLVPVLFLVPFMLGSRDLIPLDELPPVTM